MNWLGTLQENGEKKSHYWLAVPEVLNSTPGTNQVEYLDRAARTTHVEDLDPAAGTAQVEDWIQQLGTPKMKIQI